MKHTEACRADMAESMLLRSAYATRWPNYCTSCEGHGGHSHSENAAPHGSGRYWPMEIFEPCECAETGLCPRCGLDAYEGDERWMRGEMPCPHCEWNNDRNDGDSMPQPYECFCWYEPSVAHSLQGEADAI
jgi:hypothetical protein